MKWCVTSKHFILSKRCCYKQNNLTRQFPACAPRRPVTPLDISKYCFFFAICVLFFQTATKLLGQIVIMLLGFNYLTKGSVGYFFWPRDAVNFAKSLRAL
jgi:hypothetical protein